MEDNFENKITNMIYDDMKACLECVKKCLENGMNERAKITLKSALDSLEVMRSRELRKNELEEELFKKLKETESK